MTGATGVMAAGAFNAVTRAIAAQTFATNTTQTTLNVSTLAGYQAGITDITITVNSGVYLYSTDTAAHALTISGATAGDTVTLVNNGFIMGKGGNGGNTAGQGEAGTNAGPAISLGCTTYLTNNSYIGGGGGGGSAWLMAMTGTTTSTMRCNKPWCKAHNAARWNTTTLATMVEVREGLIVWVGMAGDLSSEQFNRNQALAWL